MLTYENKCNNCHIVLEIQQRITEKPLLKCPNCHQDTLERVISGGNIIIMNNVTSLIKAAETNTSKMGHYELQEKRYLDQKNSKAAKRRSQEATIKKLTGQDVTIPEGVESFCDKDTAKKLSKMTPEQQQKWVIDGK